MKKLTVAIDGHAACGKSTTAEQAAKELGYIYISSGKMYRALTYYLLKNEIDLDKVKKVQAILSDVAISFDDKSEIYLNGECVEKHIYTTDIVNHVSEVSAISDVRSFLVDAQRKIGKQGGIIMDGRDIGTVVFPGAELKIFMTAKPEVRAKRRQKELLTKGIKEDFDTILEGILQRDKQDSERKDSPLKQADDAVVMDTSTTTIASQVQSLVQLIQLIRKKTSF